MAKITRHGRGNFDTVVQTIRTELLNSALSMELVDSHEERLGDVRVGSFVFDKYYYRVGNRVSVSLTVTAWEDDIRLCAITAGGSTSALFRFSWGAERDFADDVADLFSRMGFVN